MWLPERPRMRMFLPGMPTCAICGRKCGEMANEKGPAEAGPFSVKREAVYGK
jgi:hypothetical protein